MIKVCAPAWVSIVTEAGQEACVQVAHISSIEKAPNREGTSIYMDSAEIAYVLKDTRQEIMAACRIAQGQARGTWP